MRLVAALAWLLNAVGLGGLVKTAPRYDPRKVYNVDVMCDAKDKRCPNHIGNKRITELFSLYLMKKDNDMKDVSVRVRISREVILAIKSSEPHSGRFLARTVKGSWKEIDDTLAIKWISLVLKRASIELEKLENPMDPKAVTECIKSAMQPQEVDDIA